VAHVLEKGQIVLRKTACNRSGQIRELGIAAICFARLQAGMRHKDVEKGFLKLSSTLRVLTA
jgi:hypothetical protein